MSALLADYFAGDLSSRFPARAIAGHWSAFKRHRSSPFWAEGRASAATAARQAVAELPYYLVRSGPGRWVSAITTLCDLDFILASCALGQVDGLLSELLEAQRRQPEGDELKKQRAPPSLGQDLDDCIRFLQTNMGILRRWPEKMIAFQCAANAPPASWPARQAKAVIAAGGPPWSWVEHINRPVAFDACRLELPRHDKLIRRCALSPDGRWAVTLDNDLLLQAFDANTGAMAWANLLTPKLHADCLDEDEPCFDPALDRLHCLFFGNDSRRLYFVRYLVSDGRVSLFSCNASNGQRGTTNALALFLPESGELIELRARHAPDGSRIFLSLLWRDPPPAPEPEPEPEQPEPEGEYGYKEVGRLIRAVWNVGDASKWYRGVVKDYDPSTAKHHVQVARMKGLWLFSLRLSAF